MRRKIMRGRMVVGAPEVENVITTRTTSARLSLRLIYVISGRSAGSRDLNASSRSLFSGYVPGCSSGRERL